jgi:succinoglycan biosynthesis transport protein ExoP
MSTSRPTDQFELTPQRCLQLLVQRRRDWLLPTVVCGALALVYAVFMTRYWEAYQGMVVRDEASVNSAKQAGKFADLYEMRTFQETILELAKSHQVVTTTMKKVQAVETGLPATQPDAEQIEKFRKRLSMSPPNGAEFGKTEIFYLSVKDSDRERAIRLVAELCKQVSLRIGELRQQRSAGLTLEFEKQVELASQVHQAENAKLKEFEAEVGSDLGELRLLHSATGGQSDLRQQLIDLEKESRVAEARLSEAEDLLTVLEVAQAEPDRLVAMPGSLLKIQPTLQRLKNGLVDAQLQVSKMSGTRTEDHPHVQAAIESVERIRAELHRELSVVIEGLRVDIGLSHNRLEVLNSQIGDMEKRLNRLAELRADYSAKVASVENSRTVLSQARKQLAEVRAREVAALGAQLVTPIDSPETGPYPVGLGRTMVVILGTFGGLVLGLAWLFLSLPTSAGEVAVPLEIKEAPPTAPTPRPVPTNSISPAFDFTAYTKKLREAGAAGADSVSSDKTAKPNVPVVAGLGGINSPASTIANMPLTS